MKKNTITWLLAIAPFFGFSQGVKANLYDKFLKKQRVETNALLVTGLSGKNKLSFGFTALGSALYLTISGAGWGTTTVDNGDELNLLFSNDSVVTLKSTSLQGFEPGVVQNSYRHQYSLTQNQLDALSKFDLVSLRKYSFKTFTDLQIPHENAARLKKLSALFVGELKKSNIFKSLRHISLKDIRNYIGDSVEFCSKVYRTRYYEGSADGPTLLDVQANFSDPFINVVILEEDREQFNGAPEKKYLDKDVCVSGVLTLQNDIPYLAIRNRDQIRVQSPIALDEIELFVGDSVTVTGKVFTARYLEDSKTKPTLLNVGAPYPDQPLTLVIEHEDRKNFLKPEETYFGKTLQVSGKVQEFKGKPQIVLHKANQVQILPDADPMPATAYLENETTATAKADRQPEGQIVAKPLVKKEEIKEPDERKKQETTNIEEEKKPEEKKERVTEKEPARKTEPEKVVPAQTYAEFPGGEEAFAQFIRNNMDIPDELKGPEKKTVVLSFDVDAKGIWRNMRLVTSAGKELDKELVRVLRKMPKWKPATQNGVAVATQVVYPVVIFDPGLRSN